MSDRTIAIIAIIVALLIVILAAIFHGPENIDDVIVSRVGIVPTPCLAFWD